MLSMFLAVNYVPYILHLKPGRLFSSLQVEGETPVCIGDRRVLETGVYSTNDHLTIMFLYLMTISCCSAQDMAETPSETPGWPLTLVGR